MFQSEFVAYIDIFEIPEVVHRSKQHSLLMFIHAYVKS